ncbi:MAG: MinD/ParA family protein [Syntrophomonadaceae bacterium]|nr:MinD/ParA family protein [Syntrophomonadaceae bacterium]
MVVLEPVTILIIDSSENSDLKQRLHRRSEFSVVGSTSSTDIGFTMAERFQPAIILLNIDTPGEEGLAAAEAFALEFPASSLILLTESDNKKILRHALQVGAKDVLTLPVPDTKLYSCLNKVMQMDLRRRELFSIQKKSRPEFKVITVFNTKGGVGKTTISLSLAVALKQKTSARVVLVDLDLFSGNIALMAGVEPRRTIKDLIDDINILEQDVLDDYLVNHKSGIKIVPAPVNPEFASFVEAEHVEKIIGMLSEVFNYVIIDAPTFFSDTIIPALEQADDIVIVSTADLASVQNLKQVLDLLGNLGMRNKTRIVLNKVGYTGHLKIQDLEKQLNLKIDYVIPNVEKSAIDAINMGIPLINYDSSSAAAQKIKEMATKLMASEKEKSETVFSFLKRR